MLRLEALSIAQGEFTLRADWSVAPGSVTAIIGPSGSGKSTLLSAISGFLTPQAGRIQWHGAELTHLAPGARPISMLFQDNNLFPHLSVTQNVALALTARRKPDPAQSAQVAGVLDQVGLGGMGDRLPAALSGGQQSRAALARVLVADRPLVLLDEPFSALGPGLRAEMLDLAVTTLAQAGRTLLMVTHDPDDALRVAGQLVFVDAGQAASPVDTKEALTNPEPALRDYLGR